MHLLDQKRADVDPFVKPWWRWTTAVELAESELPITATDDPVIQEAARYLRTRDKTRFPLIDQALKIFEADGLERAEIEARVLAGQTDKEIADRCGKPSQLIAAYQELFFAVRRWRGHHDWLFRNTVGRCFEIVFGDDEFRQFLAWVALACGPLVIDEVVNGFRRSARHDDKLALHVLLREDAQLRPQLQAVVALKVIPSNEAGKRWTTEIHLRLKETQSIKDSHQKEGAMAAIRQTIIALGRSVLAGEKLTPPTPRKKVEKATIQDAIASLRQFTTSKANTITQAGQGSNSTERTTASPLRTNA